MQDVKLHRGSPVYKSLVIYGVAGLLYFAFSLAIWWNVWSTSPTSTATCGCGDPALFMWFLQWPAFALTHGKSILFSTYLFHPTGINLLSNTSVLAIGVPLAPITLAFGPVATLNVASTLAPVMSSLGAFYLIRRWVRWSPGAFAGGLLYGFSPYVLGSLAYAHLMTAALVIPPLVFACLDELLIRQRHSRVRVGVVLGLLVFVQFFVSTEVLAIMAIVVVVGALELCVYGLVRDRTELFKRVRYAVRGLVAGGIVVVVGVGYPAWYALSGPAHLRGRLWPNIAVIGGYTPISFVSPTFGTKPSILLDLGGYLGRVLPSSGYLGVGVIVLVFGGLAIWRSDKVLWFFGVLACVTAVLSLGERKGYWVPWQMFDRTPILENIIEQRFICFTFLFVGVFLAVTMEKSRAWVLSRRSTPEHLSRDRTRRGFAGVAGSALGLAVAGVALGPIAFAFAPALPYHVVPVSLPQWYATKAKKLHSGEVLLTYPAPFSGIQSAMAWQAVDGMRWMQAGGGGPQGVPDRAGAYRPGFLVLSHLGFGFASEPTGTPAELRAVRSALTGWRVTMVVVADQAGKSTLQRGHDPTYAAAFMTAVLKAPPRFSADAWVWGNVPKLLSSEQSTKGTLVPGSIERCRVKARLKRGPPEAAPACVLESFSAERAVVGGRR
ncbi:MAG: hypothetical protein ACYDEP_05260 [Acidimicrobiales bacterium]